MKVSVISDTHFGYKWGEERGEDAFENAREAFERSLESDLIIVPGDVFDRKIPKQEVLDRATDILSIPMGGKRTVTANRPIKMHGDGIPVVAIHGTHERRPSSYTNPIELMEKTGHLVHLDCENIVFEKDGEKVAVHGMSGVPENQAPRKLREWGPEPVEDAYNILVVHQSIEGYVYTDGDCLEKDDFPDGFDLVIDGHIHWHSRDDNLVFPGSTVTTQARKIESEIPKGFLELETLSNELEFVELESPREVKYVELEVEGESWTEIKEMVKEAVGELRGKPIVNLKITGKTDARINPSELKNMFDAYLTVNSDLGREKVGDTSVEPIDSMENTVDEHLDTDLDIDTDALFQLLQNSDADSALELLMEVEVDDT